MLACGICAMGVRRYCCASPDCTHTRFFCQSCKFKACSSCGLKATGQWIAEQQHILPDCEWQALGRVSTLQKCSLTGCTGWQENDGFRPQLWINALEKWVLV